MKVREGSRKLEKEASRKFDKVRESERKYDKLIFVTRDEKVEKKSAEEILASNSGLVSGLSEASRARFSLVEVSQRVGTNTNNRHYVGPGRYTLRVSARDAAEPPAVEVGLAGQWPRAAAEPSRN